MWKNKLEKLLNELIKLGWKPWGKIHTDWLTYKIIITPWGMEKYIQVLVEEADFQRYHSLNDLVSIESGLWDFVCEKKLYEETAHQDYYTARYKQEDSVLWYDMFNCHYRLMLSAIQTDKGKFLLDNIKLECKQS